MAKAVFTGYASRWLLAIAVFVGMSLGIVQPSGGECDYPDCKAEGLDHLKCYQVKEVTPATEATIVLEDRFGLDPGCRIRRKVKFFCTPATKNFTDDFLGYALSVDFTCYAVKCPRRNPTVEQAFDQFGDHALTIGQPKLVCAPTRGRRCVDC